MATETYSTVNAECTIVITTCSVVLGCKGVLVVKRGCWQAVVSFQNLAGSQKRDFQPQQASVSLSSDT